MLRAASTRCRFSLGILTAYCRHWFWSPADSSHMRFPWIVCAVSFPAAGPSAWSRSERFPRPHASGT